MGEDLVLALFISLPLLIGWGLLRLYRHVHALGRSPSWLHVLAGNSLLMLFLLALLLAGGEVYFRFGYDSTDSLMYSKTSKRWFQRYWQTNANGFRDNIDYAREPEPGKRRISFLGDSFTAGHGIKNVEDRFVNRVRREHPEWEVHMLALPGFETGDELNLIRNCGVNRYKLDLVVLVYCLNDISDLIPARNQAFKRIQQESEKRGWLLNNSYFLDAIHHRLAVRRDPFMKGYFDLVRDAYMGPLWDVQKQRLKALRDEVHSQGANFAVVTFPFLHALGTHYAYQGVHDELGRLWGELDVPNLDLLPLYRPYPPEKITVGRFDAHPNEFADALAAQQIGEFVRSLLTKERVVRTNANVPTRPGQ